MQSFNPSSISFTDAAVSHFKNSLNGKPESFGIRIGVREAGCSGYEYFFEYTNEEQEGDILFDESSFKIYVDSNSFEFLKGSEVDFVSTGLNQGIIFKLVYNFFTISHYFSPISVPAIRPYPNQCHQDASPKEEIAPLIYQLH